MRGVRLQPTHFLHQQNCYFGNSRSSVAVSASNCCKEIRVGCFPIILKLFHMGVVIRECMDLLNCAGQRLLVSVEAAKEMMSCAVVSPGRCDEKLFHSPIFFLSIHTYSKNKYVAPQLDCELQLCVTFDQTEYSRLSGLTSQTVYKDELHHYIKELKTDQMDLVEFLENVSPLIQERFQQLLGVPGISLRNSTKSSWPVCRSWI